MGIRDDRWVRDQARGRAEGIKAAAGHLIQRAGQLWAAGKVSEAETLKREALAPGPLAVEEQKRAEFWDTKVKARESRGRKKT